MDTQPLSESEKAAIRRQQKGAVSLAGGLVNRRLGEECGSVSASGGCSDPAPSPVEQPKESGDSDVSQRATGSSISERLVAIKKERTEQWGNTKGVARGWDRWRITTFLEVCQAKIDRAIQAHDLLEECRVDLAFAAGTGHNLKEIQEKQKKLEFDYDDSIADMTNYWNRMLKELETNPNFKNGGMK